jgi:NADH dehydrogenase
VHLAAWTGSDDEGTVERESSAAHRLVEVARARKLAIIFVSSQAARSDAPTAYGRAKWQVEQVVLQSGGTVVRPGLVYGGQPGGLYRQLQDHVRGTFALPALLPCPPVQPIHVDDLAGALLRVAARTDLRGVALNLAATEPISFTSFLRAIAVHRLRRRRLFVPLPTLLLLPAIRLVNLAFRQSLDHGRARSLVDLPVMRCDEDLAGLGITLRPLAAGMHPSGDDRRRRLLREGDALMTYLLSEQAAAALRRRYTRAVERVCDGEPLVLPAVVYSWPSCIAILDDAPFLQVLGAAKLRWRLDAATVLAEASTAGARQFMMLGPASGPVVATAALGGVALSEAFWRLARLALAPILRRVLRQRDNHYR